MDKNIGIPIEDVEQIVLEVTQRVIMLAQINDMELQLGKTKIPTNIAVQNKIMGKWIDSRIEMVVNRLKNE